MKISAYAALLLLANSLVFSVSTLPAIAQNFPPNVTVKPTQPNPNEKHFAIPGLLNNSPQGRVFEIRNIVFYLSKNTANANIHIKYDHQNYSFTHNGTLQIRLVDGAGVTEFSKDLGLSSHRDTQANIIFDIPITTAQFDHIETLYFATNVTRKEDR